ncbi:CDP-alcohol phosphatidyltransferase family protein [Oceanispirochaeta sp.]|jgi:phosphatidylglycerophosphate synthase|uniref:CDP-alcohol phosphatidyltransferase family protein n=1 Tax=Oceanispirochaeta sp. TaxID=2035350 RepID=UPI002613C50D|nr:CDP-alcohol phosphatidyltransferase family protein [Oceanispirochaeta sp.]MDA3956731.1 CDP-alcohol phosphatidyltransferase family protein [Oceanispirochaeta sp.]
MKVNFQEILATYTDEKRASEKEEFWTYYVIRPLSWHPAWWFVNAGISANKVTVISIVFVLISAVLLTTGNLTAALWGAASLFVWGVLDCADGTVARFKKKTNHQGKYLGEFLDAAGAYAVYALILPALGLYAVQPHLGLFNFNTDNYLIHLFLSSTQNDTPLLLITLLSMAYWSAVSSLASRLLYQKYKTLKHGEFLEIKRGEASFGLKKMLVTLSQNIISATNLFLPLMIVALITSNVIPYLFVYALLNTAMLFFTTLKIVKDLK